MSFQDKLLDSFIAFEQVIDLDNPVHTVRKNALKRFESDGFPTKKDELWKYTSLKSIIQKDYSLSVKRNPNVGLKDIEKYSINDIDSYKIVFVMVFSTHSCQIQLMMAWIYAYCLLLCQKQSIKKQSLNTLIK